MTLPTFLGIGVPRSGSTWITALLEGHPDVYMAPGKEIFFFNRYYERGLGWYESLFPAENEATQYRAIGEFTPEYLYCNACPARIAEIPSITKLIVSLRNPVERAYSHYGLQLRSTTYNAPFETWLTESNTLELGFYSRYLQEYWRYFNREQILVLVFEETIAKRPNETMNTLANFLELPLAGFSSQAAETGINRSYIPKIRLGYALYVKLNQLLLKWNMHRAVQLMRRSNLKRIFGEAKGLPPIKPETRQHLQTVYHDEIERLSDLLQTDLSCWQEAN